jgi:ribosomal-protein-alanine N-acetyltransferase
VAAGSEFPSLTTSRLRLRAPVADDAPGFATILSIPAVTRFSNWPDAPKLGEVERFIRWMAKAYASGKACA